MRWAIVMVMVALHARAALSIEDGATPTKAARGFPPISEFRDHATNLLRAEATAQTESERIAATLGMIELARTLSRDDRYATSPILQQTRSRLAGRLRRIKKQTVSRLQRETRQPATIHVQTTVLAQLNAAADAVGIAPAVNAANAGDYGPLLVQLIQDTISPTAWDTRGGSSTIRYWRPGMALVVRAPQDLHERLTPLLGQLRRN